MLISFSSFAHSQSTNSTVTATPTISATKTTFYTVSTTTTPSPTPSTSHLQPELGNWIWFNLALGIALGILTAAGIAGYVWKIRKEKNAVPSYNDGVF